MLERALLMHHPLLHLHDPLLVSESLSAGTLPERPRLHPWCRLVRDRGRYLLEHGGTVVTLEGRAVEQLLPKLLPLLDGTRTVDELTDALGPRVAPAVEHALTLLESNRLLVAGADGDEASVEATAAAAFAAAVTRRTTESAAATKLTDASVAVLGSGGAAIEVGRQLTQLGIGRVTALPLDSSPDDPSLIVAAPSAAEVPHLEGLNERALHRRSPWLQLLPFDGRLVVAGPLFVPDSSACRACFVLRRGACSGYEEDFDLIERAQLQAAAPSALTSIGAGLAALISLRWIATADPTLPGHLYALEAGPIVRLSHQRLLRVPRCRVCGPPERAVASPWFEAAT